MTPNVKQFRLVVSGHEFEYEPGQHTTVHFEDEGEEVSRPYTATNLPESDQLTLAIKRYDDGTASVYMHDREPGDEIEIGDVEGNLYLRNLDDDVVFVASGTGITPLYPMVKHYVRDGSGHAHLLFGESDQAHLIYRESLDQLQAEHANLDVTYSLSDESWDGAEGHVQDHLSDRLDSFDETDFYVCGVPEMVVETTELLDERGVDEERIFTEGWEADAAE